MSCDCPSVLERIHTLETTIEVLRQKCLDTREELELELQHALREIADVKEEADVFCDWMRRDSEKSQWYYDNREEIKTLVESTKWVKTLRRAVAWVIGAVAGTIMVVQQVELWVREHMR